MKILLDTHRDKVAAAVETYPDYVVGQLLTPLTNYVYWGGVYGIDNGCYAGLDLPAFRRLLERQLPYRESCLFVSLPDVVGSARRSLELFHQWYPYMQQWPVALVAQDGLEDLEVPWDLLRGGALFIGGTNDFKLSKSAKDLILAAQAQYGGRLHTHVGRINTPNRWQQFNLLGCDTCDGSGFSRFSNEKLPALELLSHMPLFDGVLGSEKAV